MRSRCTVGGSTRSRPPTLPRLSARSPMPGKSRETIRKTVTVLAMILDFENVTPNPARDRVARKATPRESARDCAAHRRACRGRTRLLARARTSSRCSSLDATRDASRRAVALTWADVDEPRSRLRVSRAVAKTRSARFVACRRRYSRSYSCFALATTVCRERRVFQGVTADRLRTAIWRACAASRRARVLSSRPAPPAYLCFLT